MKKNLTKILSVILIVMVATTSSVFAHGGRTDSAGGHRDNKNASGLGYYHYHHGYGPHLHPVGRCPYAGGTTVTKPKVAKLKCPSSVSAKSINANYIKVSWKKVTNASKYAVYRSKTKYGSYSKIYTTTKTSYSDKNVANNTTYFYKIKALGKSTKANSNYSSIKSDKVCFRGEISLSENVIYLNEGETATIYVSSKNTTDNLIAYFDDYYFDLEWGTIQDDGTWPIYITATDSDWDEVHETVTLKFENHLRHYKKTFKVIINPYQYDEEGEE